MADLRNYDVMNIETKHYDATIAEIRQESSRTRHLILFGFFLLVAQTVRIENEFEPGSPESYFLPGLLAGVSTLVLWGVNAWIYRRKGQ